MPSTRKLLAELEAKGKPAVRAGMRRVGIVPSSSFGVPVSTLRSMAKRIGMDHLLAQRLWASGTHEARILASMLADPARMTVARMEKWAAGFDTWDICDQCCNNLFRKTPWARSLAIEWCVRERVYVKRAGFVLMAVLAVHEKNADRQMFEEFLSAIRKGAVDDRSPVRKGMSWALRQIGKRDMALHARAVTVARELCVTGVPSSRWIANDALRELLTPEVIERIREKTGSTRNGTI